LSRSILRELFRLGWPVLVAQLAVMANTVVDTTFAGRYDTIDLAAVGIGGAVYGAVFITLMGVLFGLLPIVAQLEGAGRRAEVGEQVRQAAWLALAIAAVSVVLLLAPGPLLAIAQLAPEVERKARAYLAAIALAVPAAVLFRVFHGFSTAVSQPRVIMVLNVAALAVKVPLTWALLHGRLGLPEMGAAGCALATAIAAWCSCLAAWLYCRNAERYRAYRVFARWSWPRAKPIGALLALGVPMGATFLVDVSAFTFMALFIARLGAVPTGAHQIVANVAGVAFMLPLALGNAAAVIVGQSIGARRHARARSAGILALLVGLAFGAGVGVAIALARAPIASFYTRDPAVLAAATGLLAIVAVYHVFDALQVVAVNVLRGYKRAVVPMLVYAVALWGVGLAGGYTLGLERIDLGPLAAMTPMGAPGFWIAATASLALAGGVVSVYFLAVSGAEIAPERQP
jgi:MATE family multidrug resistance protein